MANTYDGGIVTAYGAAVRGGYTGTYEQFCTEQAQFGANAAAVAAAKTAVDSAKSQVDQTVNTFTQTTVPNAVSSVQSVGTEQIGLVQNAGAAQTQAVNSAGAAQVSAVQSEGSTQTHNVELTALSAIGQINDARSDAVAAVEAAGSDAVDAVEAAETAATDAVTAAQTAAVQAVQAESTTQQAAIQTKGQETIDSIPEDYTALSGEVDDVKSAFRQSATNQIEIESGTFNDSNGAQKISNVSRLRNAVPIPVYNLVSLTLPDGYACWVFRLDENGAHISAYSGWLEGTINIASVITNETKFVNIAIKKSATPTDDISGDVATVESGIATEDRASSVLSTSDDRISEFNFSANGNLYNTQALVANKYINPNSGQVVSINNSGFAYSKTYINVTPGETICSNTRMFIAYYDNSLNIVSALQMDNTKKTVVPSDAVYARFSASAPDQSAVVVQRGESLNDEKNDYAFNLDGLDIDPTMNGAKQNTSLMNFRIGKNLYNFYNVVYGKYISPTSGIIVSTSYQSFGYSPTYIPVTPGENLVATDRMFIAYYDRFYNILSALQMDETKKTVVPEGAVYARFAVSAVDHSTVSVQIGNSIDANAGRYSFSLDGLITGANDSIVVDAEGTGDYTSLTQAVYENVDNGKTIEVMPGEYDVKAEYIALFGQTVVDNLADATTGINNFQYGIRIRDRKIVFMPGSKVVCDWTGKTVDGTHRFSVFRIEPGAELEGLYLECTSTFYGIHDDYGPTTPFTIKYKNCRIDCYNLFNANCIGGGCHKYSRHIIENCYFNNHVTSTDKVLSADVRYHNTDTANAEPEIYISNCYFSNNFNAAYYGNQTTKMKVYVNNCHAPKGINKVRESSSMNVDNVDLYKWNNEESE